MLKIEKLYKEFGSVKALNGIDISIEKGEKVVIIGPSGCGKTTLLRCINLLEQPTSGQILYEGKDIKKYTKNILRQQIGMIFQNYNLFDHLTVRENITLAPLKLKLLTKEEVSNKALKLLQSIKLINKIDKFPKQLSGGEKQRIAIVRSLMLSPKALLVDEPTSALDPETINEVLGLMNQISDEGMTMVVVTHEMNFAKSFADRIIFLDEGNVIETGTPDEIFNQPKSKRLKEFLNNIGL